MALYVPQLGDLSAASGVRSIRESLVRMAQEARQREQDAAQNLQNAFNRKRLTAADRQNALAEAHKLMAMGDEKGARAIMDTVGGGAQSEQYEVPGQQMPQAAMMPQPQRPQATADQNLTDDPNAISQSVADADWKATNPLVAADQNQQAQSKKLAMRLKGRFDDGTEWSLDPEAAQGVRQQRLQQSFGQSQDPDVRGMLPQLEAAYGASMEQPDPKEIFAQLRNTTNAKRQEAAADRRHQEGLDAEGRKREEWNRQDQINFEQAKELARINAGSRRVVTPGQKEDNERADVGAFRVAAEGWEKAANVDKLADDYDKFRSMYDNVQNYKTKGDTIGVKGALYGVARYITGPGVLTAPEYENTVTNTAGWTAALETKVRNKLWGEISPDEFKAVERFVENANKTIRSRGEQAIRGFDARFGAKSRYAKTAADDVAGYRAELQNRFGLTPPPAAMSPEDQAAVDWAKAHPKDPRAAAILKANGAR